MKNNLFSFTKKKTYQLIAVFVFSVTLMLSLHSVSADWTTPTASPPDGNPAMPISPWIKTGTDVSYSEGNVKIGTDLSNSDLEVRGSAELRVDDGDSKLRFHDPGNRWYSMGIDQSDAGKFKINYGGSIGDNNHFTMTNNGYVGIGDTSPIEKLEVNGSIAGGMGAQTTVGTLNWNHVSNARSGNGHTLLRGNATNGPSAGGYYHPFSFEYISKNGTGNMAQFAIPYNTTSQNYGMFFRTRYGGTWGAWSEMISENTAGKVGIGLTSPGSRLHVGDAIDNMSSALRIENRGISSPGDGDTHFGYYDTNNSLTRNYIRGDQTNFSAEVYAPAFIYYSDRRLKDNITVIDNSLDKINQLEGVSFNWKDGGKESIGLIAQDVEKVFPEIVDEDETTGMKSVGYGNLVAPIIEAIKELSQKLDSLFDKYLNQQDRIDDLEGRLESLENK